jgi:DNA-directed RNA polymerase alpha subunit
LVGRHGATNPAGRVRRILVCSRFMISSGRSLGEGEEMSELEPTSELPDKTPTREVRFLTRIKNALFAAGLKTVGEVRETSDEALLSLPDFAKASVAHLRETLGRPSTDGMRPLGKKPA